MAKSRLAVGALDRQVSNVGASTPSGVARSVNFGVPLHANVHLVAVAAYEAGRMTGQIVAYIFIGLVVLWIARKLFG